MNKKSLIVPIPLAMHTKLKWRAKQEGRSMSKVVRGLITEYLDGERSPVSVDAGGEEHDFYDDLYARVLTAVED